MKCPQCGSRDAISLRPVLVAKPVGSFSLAGAQMKVSAQTGAVVECGCGFTMSGHLEGATVGEDGKTFTGGHFVPHV